MNGSPAAKTILTGTSRIKRFSVKGILFPLISMLLTAGAVLAFVPVKYFSRAIVESAPGRNNTAGAAFDVLPEEMARLQGAEILNRVIDRLDLTEAYGHWGSAVSRQEARDRLTGSIQVREARDYESLPGWDLQTPLIEIGVFDINARRAADIANAIAEVYREERLGAEGRSPFREPPAVIWRKAEQSYDVAKPDLILWLAVAASAGFAVAMIVARSSNARTRPPASKIDAREIHPLETCKPISP